MRIIIIGGFLGGGKTTLLNHLVKDAIDNHLHPAVIMNEFGKQSIDGLLIEQPIPLEEITSGCICCAMKADVSQQLHQLYIHYQPDIVFIECSGVAEPLAVVDACLTPVLSPIVRIDSIVNVIDAAMANKLSTYPDDIQHLFFAQLEHSSTLFINKIDRVDLDSLSEFLVNIGQQHQDADVRVGVQGQLGLSDLIQPQALHAKPSGQHHHRLNHIFIEQPTIVNQHTFIDHLEHLPTHVYRLKGFMRFADKPYTYLVQCTQQQIELTPIALQQDIPLYLVMIGINLEDALSASFKT